MMRTGTRWDITENGTRFNFRLFVSLEHPEEKKTMTMIQALGVIHFANEEYASAMDDQNTESLLV